MSEQHKRRSPREQAPPYAAFLVRCWRDGEQWRIVLEEVATRERRGFDSVEAFLEALQAAMDPMRQ